MNINFSKNNAKIKLSENDFNSLNNKLTFFEILTISDSFSISCLIQLSDRISEILSIDTNINQIHFKINLNSRDLNDIFTINRKDGIHLIELKSLYNVNLMIDIKK